MFLLKLSNSSFAVFMSFFTPSISSTKKARFGWFSGVCLVVCSTVVGACSTQGCGDGRFEWDAVFVALCLCCCCRYCWEALADCCPGDRCEWSVKFSPELFASLYLL